ncbi:MAG: FecR family protein [Mangrovibacterium sp.]
MTEQEQIEYLLFGFLYGKLGKHEEKIIREWIAESEENRKEFERYRRIFEEQRRHIPDLDVILSREKLKTTLLQKILRTQRKDRLIIRGMVTCLILCGLFIVYSPKSNFKSEQNDYAGATIVKTEPGQMSSCILPDSTKIWLNYDSEIQYRLLSEKSGKTREVKVRGEVYFDVAKEKKVPFEVLTENTKIKVYGTQFNVRQRKDLGLQVTLIEGSMAVFTKEDVKISQLIPGEQLVLNKQGELLSKMKVDIQRAILWKEGRYEFKDVTLEEIAYHLNELYGVHIEIQNSALKDERFRCVIDRHKSLLQTLQILKETTNMSYSINGSDILLTKN